MILRRIELENFRQFFGRGTIQFAQPGPRNVTVILGQNGAGKTTLLNSFLWCFYDRLDVENPSEILCHRSVMEAQIGEEIPLCVTVIFQDQDNSYTVSRRASFKKLDGGKLEETRAPEFRIDVMDATGTTTKAVDPKQLIRQILPDNLSRFFFFRGEEMETMALQSSKKSISEGVEEFLNFTLLDQAIKNLKKVGRDFEAELSKIAIGDMKRLSDDILAAEEETENLKAKADRQQQNIDELVKDREAIERDLARSEEVRPYLEKKSKLQQRRIDLGQTELENRKALAKVLSINGFLAKSEEILPTFSKLAAAAVKAGELPAKIKPRFVDDLLTSGQCVCGRDLDENSRHYLLQWRGKEGLAVLEESINLADKSVSSLTGRRDVLNRDLAECRSAWAKTQQEVSQINGEISALDSELQGKEFGLEYVQALQGRLRVVYDDLIQKKSERQHTSDELKARSDRTEKLREERKRLTKDQSEAELIERRYAATKNVVSTLARLKTDWLSIVQGYLDGQLKENWRKVAQLDRLVEFTSEFQLSIKERGPDGSWITSAPSSANLRALALCFVSALIKLASEIAKDEASTQNKRQNPFQGGDYPIVMDAPFATMDAHFKRTVPLGLRAVVPQMILIVNHDQWDGEVSGVLESAIGNAYVLELHTPGREDTDLSVEFRGHRIPYVVGEIDANTDWSIIQEAKL